MTTPDSNARPDVLVILADDMGFSDLGCYGGEVHTPNLDRLSGDGVRLSQFYNTARCSPSRASLMTGLHPHQTGIGILTFDDSPDGYPGTLNTRCATMAELLGAEGYATYLSGKWHLASDMQTPNDSWPTRRGFQHFFGTLIGANSYFDPHTLMRDEEEIRADDVDPDFYYTDAISDEAARFVAEHQRDRADQPMFCYVAYTSPHWPLHAREEDVRRYATTFADGWDALRERRMRRLVDSGLIEPTWPLSDRDPTVPAWSDAADHEWEAHRMAVYAAQVDRMDQGIGRILAALEAAGRLDNTLVLFLSDNGACAEAIEEWVPDYHPAKERTRDGGPVTVGNAPEIWPGPESTYTSYGRSWANLSNTPFREYKHWVHEGGIATPLIAHWPDGFPDTAAGSIRHRPHQLPDIMATVLDASGVDYPTQFEGRSILPLEGHTMLPTLRGGEAGVAGVAGDAGAGENRPAAAGGRPDDQLLFWEHEGNAAVRRGSWKLVRKYPRDWELYDLSRDRTELADLAGEHPDLVRQLSEAYKQWAQRCGVLPREQVLEGYRRSGHGLPTYE